MKKTIILALILIGFFSPDYLFPLFPVYAQESTGSANLQSKLKALQEEIASKAAKLKVEVGKKLQNKAYVGFIQSKSSSSLTLATKSGTKIVTVNEDTVYSGKNKPTLKTLDSQTYVAALGDIDDGDNLIARKVVVLSAPADSVKKIIVGQVVSAGDKIITLTDKAGQNTSISLSSDTTYKFGSDSTSADSVKIGRSVIAVGTTTKSGIIKARFVYIFPQAILKNTQASSSAVSK